MKGFKCRDCGYVLNRYELLFERFQGKLSLVSQVSTCAAEEFYQEKKSERILFDEREQENEEFRSRIRNLEIPYRKLKITNWSSLVELWEPKCKGNPRLYEKDVTHGLNCRRISGKKNCSCSILRFGKGWKETYKAKAKKEARRELK